MNLDSWSAEQVQTMRVMGNEKARKVYEHDLPPQFRRPTSDSQMEQFIRSKYEQKRYMIRDFKYPRVDVSELPKSYVAGAKKAQPIVVSSVTSPKKSPIPSSNGNDLLGFDLSGPATTTNSQPAGNIFDDFAGLSVTPSQKTDDDDTFDDFGSFVSASAAAQTNTSTNDFGFADFSSAPTTSPSTAANDLASVSTADFSGGSKKSNADILSLFGPSSGSGAANGGGPLLVAPGGFTAFGLQAAPQAFGGYSQPPAPPPQQPTSTFDSLSGLTGLNFNSAPPPQNHLFNSVPQHQNHNFGAKFTPSPTVTSPTKSTFSIPNKTNAFADLDLGQVMKTTYGQNAIHSSVSPKAPTVTSSAPAYKPPPANNTMQNDLFDMFATAPPPVTSAPQATTTASNGLDDLLGF